MDTQKVKGSVLKSRLSFIREQFGEEGLQRVIESLDPEDQTYLNRLVPVAWLPYETGKRHDDAIVRV